MEAVVEFQGFKDNNNKFIVKELAVVSKCFQSQIIFTSPYNQSLLNSKMIRTNRWLTRHYHHIHWDDDGVPFRADLISALLKPFSIVYTKGLEKKEFLKEFHDNAVEITSSCTDNCIYDVKCLLGLHNNCALKNAVHFFNCSLPKEVEFKHS